MSSADSVRPSGRQQLADGLLRRLRASYDDLLALAYLGRREAAEHDDLVRTCVRPAVADAGSHPLAVTRRGFERSLDALRG